MTRAPFVDVVFGPQTLHRLPQLIETRKATGRPQVDISFPEIEKFDHLPPARTEGVTAFVSIMDGCRKFCSFCVVPYTRGEEVSRPLGDVLTEIAVLADQGIKEINLLGQNVNAYLGVMDDGSDLDVYCASEGNFGLIGVSRKGLPGEEFAGKLIIYLEDGSVLTCNESEVTERIDDQAKAVYSLTADQ